MRVVSLVPSATETLLAWGVDVVACTRFCEQPALAHVGGTKDPHVDAIVALRPDLVVMDREENRGEDADALARAGLNVYATHVVSLTGLADELAALAAAVGAEPAAWQLTPPRAERGVVFVPIWRRPWMSLGGDTYAASVLAHLGLRSAFADAATRYPTVTLDEVRARRPDVVLLPSEPYPFAERHVPEITAALGDVPIELIDGQDLVWWGSRTPAALVRLGDVVDRVLTAARRDPPARP